jgi:hypothetical protein
MPRDEQKPFTFAAACKITAEVAGDDGKPKLGRFEGLAYSGAPMNPEGWWTPIIVDLDGVKLPSQHRPVLRQHDHNQIVGHTESVTVDAKGIHMAGVLSGEPQHVSKVAVPASNGFQWQLSIGATPVRTEFLEPGETSTVNGREVSGPLTISRETEIGEISFVPLGADGDTSAKVTANKRRVPMFKAALKQIAAGKYSDEEIDGMDEDGAKAALKKCMDDGDDKKPEAKASDDGDEDDKEEKKTEAKASKSLKDFRSAMAAETGRINRIMAHGAKFPVVASVKEAGKTVNLIEHAINEDWSFEKFEMRCELEQLRAGRPGAGVGVPGGLAYTTNSPEITDAVLEAAVFQSHGSFKLFDSDFYSKDETGHNRRVNASQERKITSELNGRYTDKVQQTAHTVFKGRAGLQQILTRIAASAGYRGGDSIRDEGDWANVSHFLSQSRLPVQADGGSTISVANVLANVQNKFMLQGYLFTEQAFMDVVQVLPVKDFKPTSSIALFGDTEFKDLGTSAEIEHASLNDQAFANQASMRARMITIPLQNVINDDLGMLGQVPMILGRGWGLKVNKLVWSVFLNPGNDEGGSTAFYAATHTIPNQVANSNLATSSPLSSAGLQSAKTLFDRQVDPVGNPLGIDAELLVYPPELDVTALELMKSQLLYGAYTGGNTNQAKQPATNIWQGRYKPVMSRYLSNASYTGYSTTSWYLLANPAIMPVVQIAAWNGNMVPTVQTAGNDWQFNMLGISMRGFGGIGVTKQNFRGGVKANA